jgi:hypothetical protein
LLGVEKGKYMNVSWVGAIALVLLAGCANSPMGYSPAEPTYLYASQSGRPTLDMDETGGNPFATAFVQMLEHTSLTFDELRGGLSDITLAKSKGFQRSDMTGRAIPGTWSFLPASSSGTRVALVVVFSEYSVSSTLSSLPGARYDASRVGIALLNAGFTTTMIVDPTRDTLTSALGVFAESSVNADVSLIYTTGHGIEVNGNIYLLPGTFSGDARTGLLDRDTISIYSLSAAMLSSQANLLLYGGCRNKQFPLP